MLRTLRQVLRAQLWPIITAKDGDERDEHYSQADDLQRPPNQAGAALSRSLVRYDEREHDARKQAADVRGIINDANAEAEDQVDSDHRQDAPPYVARQSLRQLFAIAKSECR